MYYNKRRRGRRSGKRDSQPPSSPLVATIILLSLGFAVVLTHVIFPMGVSPEWEISPSEHHASDQEPWKIFPAEHHTLDQGPGEVSPSEHHALDQGPVQKTYPYTLWGKKGSIDLVLYEGVNKHLSLNSPKYHGNDREYYLEYINDDTQREHLLDLVDCIKAETSDADTRARIAISLVQHIPYDFSGMFRTTGSMRYPYQVLYDGEGICSEKSLLAAFLLKELGYGVALLEFTGEKHMVVGVKAPARYTYKDTGYAFVEMTAPSIITDADGEYMFVGKLASNPVTIPVSDGKSLMSLDGEFQDALEYRKILAKGLVLEEQDYQRWQTLAKKYGIR